jgi:hypothetical protein
MIARYQSHIARTDEYGSRCEYCLASWPCAAVDRADRVVTLETALRRIGAAASAGADALAMHDPATRSRLAIQGRFEAIADLAQTALREDTHED